MAHQINLLGDKVFYRYSGSAHAALKLPREHGGWAVLVVRRGSTYMTDGTRRKIKDEERVN